MNSTVDAMPADDKYDDDDYVAKLLAEDAKKSSQRYAAVGLSALLPKRPTNGAPKPNTRFLSHIVREADNHNAALKRKEELEAKIRLREMSRQKNKSREDKRNVDEDGRERKRRRTNDVDDGRLRYEDREDYKEKQRGTSPPRENKHRDKKRDRTLHRSERSHREHRDESKREKSHRGGDEGRDRERSKRDRSRTPEHNSQSHHRPDRPRTRERKHRRSKTPLDSEEMDSESDPLSDVIGPKPVPRGRGHKHNIRSRSDIDAHFSSTYDPSLDVQPESDGDGNNREGEQEDWDMALEALRDRAMWKMKQSERLREAGFGEEEIRKWEVKARVGGPEDNDGDIKDVRWKRRGETKDWDLGKEDVT